MAYRQRGLIIILAEAQPPCIYKERLTERRSLSAQHGGRAANPSLPLPGSDLIALRYARDKIKKPDLAIRLLCFYFRLFIGDQIQIRDRIRNIYQ